MRSNPWREMPGTLQSSEITPEVNASPFSRHGNGLAVLLCFDPFLRGVSADVTPLLLEARVSVWDYFFLCSSSSSVDDVDTFFSLFFPEKFYYFYPIYFTFPLPPGWS